MKYLKYFINIIKKILIGIKNILIGIFTRFIAFFIFGFIMLISFWAEGYTLEDFGIEGFNLNPNDYCNLTDVDYTAVLHDDPNGNANVEITEYLTFDVHAASKYNPFKELWRELPEDYVDGLRVTYDVKSVSQVLDNGVEIPYTETSKMYWEDYDYTKNSTMYWHHSDGLGRYPDNDESVLIYIPWTYREKMTFKIVYSLNNAALKYNDCSELYLSMYSGNSIKKLNSYKAQILIPNDLMPSTYHAYTFGTAKSRIPFTESDSINPGYYTFSIDLDKSDLKFNYHNRYIEFCLLAYGKDKHIFTQNAPNNYYSSDNVLNECILENKYYETENIIFNTLKTLLLIASIFIVVIIIFTTKRRYKKIKEKYKLYDPEVDYEYFRDIPQDLDPFFASELVFMNDPFDGNKEKQEEYAAVLLSLMRKKYVTLVKINAHEDWNDKNTKIIIEPTYTYSLISSPSQTDPQNYSPVPVYKTINTNNGDTLEPLTTSERLYLDLLKRYARFYISAYSESLYKNDISITVKELQDRINYNSYYANSFVKDMERKTALESGVMQGYFQNANYDIPKKELNINAKTSLVLGLILLIIVNFISYFTPMALGFGAYTILGIALLWRYFYLTIKASNAVLFTQFGANEQAKWYGLYNFLNSNTLINEKEVHDVALWEKYLIYATAFGISEKVIKALKIHAVKLNINTSPILNHHSYIHSSNFHRTSRSFGHSLHTSSRGGSFGGFSGHGYGGGGRGGGGGGGGH